ncbi:GAK5 protein, partial [Anthoscopus minutus]|nr:GAK5 protein [Anthoscopus minutus]
QPRSNQHRGLSGTLGVCFGCGKPRRLKRDCLALKGAKPQAIAVCPWCCRGPHFANQCHSKYDSEGHLIQGNQNQSVGWCRAQTQMPQPPQQIQMLQLPPWMPPPQASHGRSSLPSNCR